MPSIVLRWTVAPVVGPTVHLLWVVTRLVARAIRHLLIALTTTLIAAITTVARVGLAVNGLVGAIRIYDRFDSRNIVLVVTQYVGRPLLDVLAQLLIRISCVMRRYLFLVRVLGRIQHEHRIDNGVTV